ncbi:FAD-binding domain-containing protein [Thozetella sp. PMI_491]|nr:FAD-binding domain-containing protein [Thozetella sp. PMI_491]
MNRLLSDHIPGDPGWPTNEDCGKLNKSVEGRLIATPQVASLCHEPNYYEAAYTALKTEWSFSEVYYSLEVACPDDVRAGIKFSKDHGVRLVIKNTGHDLLGKSTGKGGLALWTHKLDSLDVVADYDSQYYTGPAIKIGDGVLARLSNGDRGCPSGGYGMITGLSGLGADDVLEWEIVSADGSHLIATPNRNSEIYWALSGGGGSTYGVVLSMTARLYDEGRIGSGYLTFNASEVGMDTFWKAVEKYHAVLPSIIEAGATALYTIASEGVFSILALAARGRTAEQVTNLLLPLLKFLDNGSLDYVWIPSSAESSYDYFSGTFGPLPWGLLPVSQRMTSRIIPRAPPRPPTAVLPAWREALTHCMVIANWDRSVPFLEMRARQDELVTDFTLALVEVTPRSGTYMNEGNPEQPNWRREFFGDNWSRLSEIKAKYDPEGLFYAPTTVRSEAWMSDSDGRLCKARGSRLLRRTEFHETTSCEYYGADA